MAKYKLLNRKAIKEILALIKQQWGAEIDLDYAVLQDTKNKIYLINKKIAEIDLDKLRVNSMGIYFGLITNNELRLSIEGSEIIGPQAKKNIIELTEEQKKAWLRGEDIEFNHNDETFVLLKYNFDFLGTGKYKQGKILNYVPKERRLRVNN